MQQSDAGAMLFAAAAKWLRATTLLMAVLAPMLAAAASTTVTANVCHPAIAPTTFATTTSSPTTDTLIDTFGTAEPNALVDITKNGNSVATILADSSGVFGVSISLSLGDNHLVATASDACGHQAVSPELLITRNPVPPLAPVILEPQ